MKALLKRVSATLFAAPVLMLGLAFALPAAPALAEPATCDNIDVSTGGVATGADCAQPSTAPENLFGANSVFRTVTNILLFIIGAIAVIMLIIGGVRYVVSSGDQNAVTGAKNTILYAIIGIIVAFLAYAAVNFVSDQLEKGTNTAGSQQGQ